MLALASFWIMPVVTAVPTSPPVVILPFVPAAVFDPSFPARVLPATSRASFASP